MSGEVLQEDGDFVLQEDGAAVLQEDGSAATAVYGPYYYLMIAALAGQPSSV